MRIKNKELYLASKEFIKKSILILEPHLGNEVLAIIGNKPYAQRGYYQSLFSTPEFWRLIDIYKANLEKVPAFRKCKKLIHKDRDIKNIEGRVSARNTNPNMTIWDYYSYILGKILNKKFFEGKFDARLFTNLYLDFEQFCYNDVFAIKDVSPLLNLKVEGLNHKET